MTPPSGFQVVPWRNGRFAIADSGGRRVDDAQGYGYTTREKAAKALWWKFGGGREGAAQAQRNYHAWVALGENRKHMVEALDRILEDNFKQIGLGAVTLDDVRQEIETRFGEVIPEGVWRVMLRAR